MSAQPSAWPVDAITRLQLKATELCQEYTNAIGRLQNEAPPVPLGTDEASQKARAQCCQTQAEESAAAVVRIHTEMAALIDELEASHASRQSAQARIAHLHEEHAQVVDKLRTRVAEAEGIRADLKARVAGVLEVVAEEEAAESQRRERDRNG